MTTLALGTAPFRRPDSKSFEQGNVEKAHDFSEKYGPRSIVPARSVPTMRTFPPIAVGVSRMDHRTFAVCNAIGGVARGSGVTVRGHFLGQTAFVENDIEAILIGIVVVSALPVAFELLKARRSARCAS